MKPTRRSHASRRCSNLVLGGLAATAAVVAAPRDAAARKPTMGVEWEIWMSYTGVIGQTGVTPAAGGKPAALAPNDPAAYSQQRILCTTKMIGSFPLVAMTHDLPWIPRGAPDGNVEASIYVEGARTLEIVTGPLDHDDDAGWAKVHGFVKTYFEALSAVCGDHRVAPVEKYRAVAGVRGPAPICFASAKDVAARINLKYGPSGTAPDPDLVVQLGTAGTGSTTNCGEDLSHNPSGGLRLDNVGFFMQRKPDNSAFYNLDSMQFSDANTQVNIALKLAHLGSKDATSLFSDTTGVAYRAYRKAWDRKGTWTHPDHVKGFFLLYLTALNVHADATYRKLMSWMRKNAFDLYVKTPLGVIYDAVKANLAATDPLQISVNPDKISHINDNYCVAKGESAANICSGYTTSIELLPGEWFNQEEVFAATWAEGLLEGTNKNPMGISKPPGAIGSGADTYVLIEARNTRHKLNAAAHMSPRAAGWVNAGHIREVLANFVE